ncbi:ABC-type nitrate/sulfonate/bicarbonate transport system substrate-binding protein [Saccharothrix tamanrassetensis]|uniref:ABC-type nitrate/sulfonate/bicarbonate transport system substrate-binding protein n=1 Tax=Saccharothrix tamanrassetensis TaxID=1051531 RepID=A0A841C919_9PSEU|nr:ABC transporter substrate-binding protein [Saccharothrix tamanrassetensis]MBB5953909.1 ABC-type nitrate/sulfonate/bicarbonate transport system substrate-binding protein [Saccharothrix tamanrassetensis]
MTTRRGFLALLAAATVGCGTTSGGAGETKSLRYQGWSGLVLQPELAADLGFLEDVSLEWVGNTTSGPQDVQAAATGEIDFGGAFNGTVVKLVGAGAPVRSVIGYYGIDNDTYNGFYVPEDSPIREPRDLVGRTVGMNSLGAHSAAMLGLYLQRNGFSPDEAASVEVVAVPPVSTEQSLRQRQVDVAVLGGIMREKAVAAGGLRPLFTDFGLLGPFTAGTYVLTERFIEGNADTVRTFVTGVARAIEWTRSRPREEVVARFTEIMAKRERNEDASSLKYWKSTGVARPGGWIQEREMSLWLDWLADRGDVDRSRVTPSDCYTNEFNGVGS